MRKPTLNFTVDFLAFIAFLLLTSTGVLMVWILPAGQGNLTVWGMNRHGWGDIHFWVAATFLMLIGTHIGLHWNWIKCMIVGKSKELLSSKQRVLIAILAFVFLIAIILAPLLSPVSNRGNDQAKNHYPVEVHK